MHWEIKPSQRQSGNLCPSAKPSNVTRSWLRERIHKKGSSHSIPLHILICPSWQACHLMPPNVYAIMWKWKTSKNMIYWFCPSFSLAYPQLWEFIGLLLSVFQWVPVDQMWLNTRLAASLSMTYLAVIPMSLYPYLVSTQLTTSVSSSFTKV